MLRPKLLVLKDEKILALDISSRLEKIGYIVMENTDYNEALKKVAAPNQNLVLIDIYWSKEINSVQMADFIQKTFPVPVLYLTDYSQSHTLNNQLIPSSSIHKQITEDIHTAIEMTIHKHQIERKLQEEKQKLMAIINSMSCAVIVTDANSSVQMINPVAEALTGWQNNEAYGKDLAEVFSLVESEEAIDNLSRHVMEASAVERLSNNWILVAKNGTKIPIEDNVTPIRDADGNITGKVLVFQDITQRKQTEAQLLRNAFYDALTGLPNRVLFLDRLRQSFERSKRRNNYHFAVLFLDLDGFKGINDNFGHRMGDDFLVEIAQRLKSILRTGDTVARFGGDEFAVLIEDIKDVTDAINVALRIQETVGKPLHLNGHQMNVTASIGIALNSSIYEQPENLLRDADVAMYRAKQQGKAHYTIFNTH